MEIKLTLSEILDLVEMSDNKAFTTAILEGRTKEYKASFPSIGTKGMHKEIIPVVVKSVDFIKGTVSFKAPIVNFYPEDNCEGSDYSRNRGERYKYPKLGVVQLTTISLYEWNDYNNDFTPVVAILPEDIS